MKYTEKKVVHFNMYDPTNSLFKGKKNEKAQYQITECSNPDCVLLKKTKCTTTGSFGNRCPYGTKKRKTGFTQRAMSYYDWISDAREKYDGIPFLEHENKVLHVIGEYIYLPYNLMAPEMFTNGALKNQELWEGKFLKLEHFTPSAILEILSYRPKAMMGGEIESYQKEQIPKFITHLSEKLPDLLEMFSKVYHDCKLNIISNIGRKAILQTLNPNEGTFTDIHHAQWVWDGEFLTSFNSKANFMLTTDISEVRIKPKSRIEVKITDNNQVNTETEFID